MNNAAGALTYFLLIQLLLWLLLVAGGIYLLYALGRAAAGIDRVANALEILVAQKAAPQDFAPPLAPATSAQSFVPTNAAAAPQSENRGEL